MATIWDRLFAYDYMIDYMLKWHFLLFLLLMFVFFQISKFLYSIPILIAKWRHPEDLADFVTVDKQLVSHDNKGLAISFSGYLIGVGLVMQGAFATDKTEWYEQLFDAAIFSCIGFFCLFISQVVNDLVLMFGFNNAQALLKKKGNLAVGIFEAGTSISSGLLVSAAIRMPSTDYAVQIGITFLWFALGQLAIFIFCKVYEIITKYDDRELIRRGRAAAGLGYALTIISIAIVISNPIGKSDSLVAFGISYGVGSVLIILCRFFVDFVTLYGRKLDDEVAQDDNWGASFIEGMTAITVALIWASFMRPVKEACE